jgi:hypothetical protein
MKYALATQAFRVFRPALRPRAMAGLALCAMTLWGASSAQAQLPIGQQPLLVVAGNLKGNLIDSLTLSPGITEATPLNTDGSSYVLFDSLAFIPNQSSTNGTLDIIASSPVKGELVRYSASNNNYSSGQVIYPNSTCSPATAGLTYPTRIAADAVGNLFVVSLNPKGLGPPSLWVLPINSVGSCIYGNPVLIDKTFGTVKPALLADILVAGSPAVGAQWNVGDILVLGDPQVLVYAHSTIYALNGSINTAQLPLTAPTSIAVTRSQFAAELAPLDVPLTMDLWPGDPTQSSLTGVGLLFATLDGRIVRFDSGKNAFAAQDFARGSELVGPSHLRVGTYLGTPNVFVTEPGLLTGKGAILRFGDAQSGSANVPQSFNMNVGDPNALAVTTSSSVQASTCRNNTSNNGDGCIIFPGTSSTMPEVALDIQCPMEGGTATTLCPTGQILAQQCIATDPRVTVTDGVWSCANSPLNVSTLCPVPQTILPPFLCAHAGAAGNQFVIMETSAQQPDQNALNNLFVYYLDSSQVLPSMTYDLTCSGTPTFPLPNLPLTAWAPRSDMPNVEGTIVEGLDFIDSIGSCEQGKQYTKSGSMTTFGIALDTNNLPAAGSAGTNCITDDETNIPDETPLECFIDTKYANLQLTIQNACSTPTPQITSGECSSLESELTTSQSYFDDGPTSSAYVNCALASLWYTNSFVVNNLSAFSVPGSPPTYNINPSGEIIQRVSNLYLEMNNYFPTTGSSPPPTWPPPTPPGCTIS